MQTSNLCASFYREDDDLVDNKEFIQSSAFPGADSLFDGHENCTYFVNLDSTGFYVFSLSRGLDPIAKWVRRNRRSEGSSTFEPLYTAAITYAGDRVNGYKITNGLYVDTGMGTNQAGAAASAAAPAAVAAAAAAVVDFQYFQHDKYYYNY